MLDKYRLWAEMRRRGYTYARMAERLGITENGFCRKMNGANDFTLPEIRTIISVLEMDDSLMKEIFFSN